MTGIATTWADEQFNLLEAAYDEADKYKRENAALRELIRDMHKELAHMGNVFLMDHIEKRMAELGIMEVDE